MKQRGVLEDKPYYYPPVNSKGVVGCYRQRGQPVESGMGVVVQEMAVAEAAGVVFTVDPASGDPSSIIITANYGLGEVRWSVLSSIPSAASVSLYRFQ